MKDLYIITIELDEDSEYFAELDESEAAQLRRVLGKLRQKWSMTKIKDAPGFNSFNDLKSTFLDMAS
jgi:hypothetical protein